MKLTKKVLLHTLHLVPINLKKMKLYGLQIVGKETDIKWKDEKRTITFHDKMLPKGNQVLLTENQRNHKQKTKHKCAQKITQINKKYQHITEIMKIAI